MRIRTYLLSSFILLGCATGENGSPMGPSNGVENEGIEIPQSAQPDQPTGPIEVFSRTNAGGVLAEEYQFYVGGAKQVKHGFYRRYWDNGNRREVGTFIRGERRADGYAWRTYGEVGELAAAFALGLRGRVPPGELQEASLLFCTSSGSLRKPMPTRSRGTRGATCPRSGATARTASRRATTSRRRSS